MALDKSHPLYQEDLRYIASVIGTDSLKGKSVLITGATGLIGTQMIDALMSIGDIKVIATGRSREKAALRLGEYFSNPSFTFLEQDVNKPFDPALAPDYILPLASNTHPLAYSKYPVETIMTNIDGARNAFELARFCGSSVLYPSSVEIYGNAYGEDVFTEDYSGRLNLSNSRSCYTESKRVCEAMCQSYASEKGMKVKIVRLSRVFGPTMLESDTKASSQFIQKAVRGEDIVLKSNGEQYFSYTYSADAVAAMLYVMLHGENAGIYNISNEACNVRLKDFAGTCAAVCGKKVVFDLPSETEMKGFSIATKAILSNTRLLELGFAPVYGIEDAIDRTVRILKHQA
ncbi:MAG: NAD-dependent epimerase/dehydratase family protein [Bacteroidia bacterium]|nr:NAD-dependent epimerase/dehydratase family protein [Bacteroidia bacterium]